MPPPKRFASAGAAVASATATTGGGGSISSYAPIMAELIALNLGFRSESSCFVALPFSFPRASPYVVPTLSLKVSKLPSEKGAIYGALDKWTAWETEFPVIAAAKALKILRKWGF